MDNKDTTSTPYDNPPQAHAPEGEGLKEIPDPVDPMSQVESTPQTSTQANQDQQTPDQKTPSAKTTMPENTYAQPDGRNLPKILLTLFLAFSFLTVGTSGALALIAYEKVTLPDQELQYKILYTVQSLPFAPKTTKYILLKSAQVHRDVSSAYIDASIATKSSELSNILGMGDIDISVKGPLDVSNPTKPNVELNINLSDQIDLDIILLDEKGFFRVNKIPIIIYALLFRSPVGYEDNQFVNQWVSYNFGNMDTDARETLDDRQTEDISSLTEKRLIKFSNTSLVPLVTMMEDSIDGFEAYKLDLKLDKTQMQSFGNELQSIFGSSGEVPDYSPTNGLTGIDNFEATLWIDQKDFYLRKTTIAFTLVSPGVADQLPSNVLGVTTAQSGETVNPYSSLELFTGPQNLDVATSINMSRFGEKFDITEPETAITFEKYIEMITQYYISQAVPEQTTPNPDEDFAGFENKEADPTFGIDTAPTDYDGFR